MFLTIIIFLAVLSVLVLAHEWGHFMTARKFGVKAEEFGLGFPPRAFGIYKNDQGQWKKVLGGKEVTDCPGTVYSLNWLPLGGFVKIKGENGPSASSGLVEEKDSFASRPVWQRGVMLSAGVIMNIVLAFILFSVCFMIGAPQLTDNGGQIQIEEVIAKSPAEVAGLKPWDTIVSIDSQKFFQVSEVQNFINQKKDQILSVEIKRGRDTFFSKIKPEIKDGTALIGVSLGQVEIVRYPWYKAVLEGFKMTFVWIWLIIIAFYELIKGIVTGHGVTADLAGPVGIAKITGQAARMGFVYLMQFTALLSINLAVINFFPFPALDGGRFLFLIIEKIKRGPVKRELENAIHNIGFILLMILVLVVTLRDVSKFGGFFSNIWNKIF